MNRKYLIGEVAKFLDVSTDTLRYYDKFGIVSPTKDETNGYRYYNMDHIITLTYVLALKELDMPLDDIRYMIYNYGVSEMREAISKQEKIIDNKIMALFKVKKTINNYHKAFVRAESYLDKFEIRQSPTIIYKNINEDIDDSTVKVMNEFSKVKEIDEYVYSVLINKDVLKEINNDNNEYLYCVSGILDNEFENNRISESSILPSRKCLYTVIGATLDVEIDQIKLLKKYIDENNINVEGDILFRAIAFENIKKGPKDFYEVYIPIA